MPSDKDRDMLSGNESTQWYRNRKSDVSISIGALSYFLNANGFREAVSLCYKYAMCSIDIGRTRKKLGLY